MLPATAAPPSTKGATDKLFVVVDDVDAIRIFLQSLLVYNGHRCEVFGDAESTVEWVSKHEPDAILVDLNLGTGDMDGLSLIAKIRDIKPNVPIVVLTGMGMDNDNVTRAVQAGASGYLTKGLSAETVYTEILKYVR